MGKKEKLDREGRIDKQKMVDVDITQIDRQRERDKHIYICLYINIIPGENIENDANQKSTLASWRFFSFDFGLVFDI